MLQAKRSLDGHGITWRDWQVLTNLMLGGETPRSPGELASTLMVTTGAMTNVLDRLEEAGLIRRVRNPADRRSVIVEATDAGVALWYTAVNELGGQEAGIVSVLTTAEQRQLNTLLRKLLGGSPTAVGTASPTTDRGIVGIGTPLYGLEKRMRRGLSQCTGGSQLWSWSRLPLSVQPVWRAQRQATRNRSTSPQQVRPRRVRS